MQPDAGLQAVIQRSHINGLNGLRFSFVSKVQEPKQKGAIRKNGNMIHSSTFPALRHCFPWTTTSAGDARGRLKRLFLREMFRQSQRILTERPPPSSEKTEFFSCFRTTVNRRESSTQVFQFPETALHLRLPKILLLQRIMIQKHNQMFRMQFICRRQCRLQTANLKTGYSFLIWLRILRNSVL